MKVTEFQELAKKEESISRKLNSFNNWFRSVGECSMEKYQEKVILESQLKEVREEMKKAPTVYVSYCIGYRSYYTEVVKLGKSYFHRGEKMTKKNGYR